MKLLCTLGSYSTPQTNGWKQNIMADGGKTWLGEENTAGGLRAGALDRITRKDGIATGSLTGNLNKSYKWVMVVLVANLTQSRTT